MREPALSAGIPSSLHSHATHLRVNYKNYKLESLSSPSSSRASRASASALQAGKIPHTHRGVAERGSPMA